MSTTSPAPGPRARWQRLGEELELLAAFFRLASDEADPDAPRRVRSLVETALLLRPLVARCDEKTVVDRLERQLQLAREWLAWRRQQIHAHVGTPASASPARAATLSGTSQLSGMEWLWNSLGTGQGVLSLSRLLPLLLLVPGFSPRPEQSGKEGKPAAGLPFSSLLKSLGSLLRSGLGDGLSGLPALLSALLKAGEDKTTAKPANEPPDTGAPGGRGALPTNITALLPQAEKLANDPEAVGNLLRRAEEKLGKDGLERLQDMARRLAGEMGGESAG